MGVGMFSWFGIDLSESIETIENVGLFCLGSGITIMVFGLLYLIKRHFKVVMALSGLIAAIAFLLSVL